MPPVGLSGLVAFSGNASAELNVGHWGVAGCGDGDAEEGEWESRLELRGDWEEGESAGLDGDQARIEWLLVVVVGASADGTKESELGLGVRANDDAAR